MGQPHFHDLTHILCFQDDANGMAVEKLAPINLVKLVQ